MALTQVTGPYPIFTDLDGSPLDDGYLYIGAVNQDPETNPIQAYWDSNLTIPATQPIRTNNGYAWRNGTPGLIYTAGQFSITIRNKKSEFVLYSPVGYGFDPGAVSASVVKNDFTGDGVETDFTLSSAPSTKLATNAFINGVYQEKDSYTLAGNVLTFSVAPPLNSSIEIMTNETGVINSGNATAISYTLTAPGAVAQTVQTKLEQYVSVKDFGAVGDGVTDDTAAIQAAEDYCAASGQALLFPGGTYRCNSGLTKKSVNWQGAGQKKTVLAYYGNSVFIDATGTNLNRVICTMSDIGFNGTNAGNASIGITLGWNQRSTPLVRVNIVGFGHYGIYFNDQNWIVDFYDVVVEFCGNRTNNSSGIYKDPTVTGSTWNDIGFYSLNVEACGSASSVAGAIHIVSNTANRGLYFYGADVEGNFGTAEIYISNQADCQFINLYMEVISAQALNAVQLYGVNGGFSGGYITGDNPAVNVDAVKIRPGAGFVLNEIQFDRITIRNFANSINAEDAKVWTGQIYSDAPLVLADPSTSAQWSGNFAPRVSAVKNAIQTIPNATFTKVTFETEIYDLTNSFSGSTFKPQTIGTYQINASVAWDTAVDQDRLIIAIYKRGGEYKSFVARASGTGEQCVQINCQIETDLIDDTIEIYVRQDSGAPKDIQANTARTYFMASLIGRTVL